MPCNGRQGRGESGGRFSLQQDCVAWRGTQALLLYGHQGMGEAGSREAALVGVVRE